MIPAGVKPFPQKVQAITEFPKPENIAELKRFLDMLNLYRYVLSNAAAIQAPLHKCLKYSKKKDDRKIPYYDLSSTSFEK